MGEAAAIPPPTPEQARHRWQRRWRLLKRACYVALALALLDLIATIVTGLMLRGELGRARSRGDLLEVKQLTPQVPSGKANAADLYLMAFNSRHVPQGEEVRFSNLEGTPASEWSDGDTTLVRRVAGANAGHYRMLTDASRIPGCAFPVDWSAGPATLFPHLAKLRGAARMLQMRAALMAWDGQVDSALADCATLLRMAEHAKLEPTVIGQLVGYAIQGIAILSLQEALSGGTPSPERARALADQIAAIDQTAALQRALKGEVSVFGMPLYATLRHGSTQVSWSELLGLQSADQPRWMNLVLYSYRSVGRPIANLDEITYLRAAARHIAASSLPWPKSREGIEATDRWLKKVPLYRGALARELPSSFTRTLESGQAKAAALDAAGIALALTVYRSQRGTYPASLVQLEQAGFRVPNDPFGGKAFRYHKDASGVVVYSVGPDVEDDGGRPLDTSRHMSDEQRREAQSRYDIPFRLRG
jgi:hypothetical protein